MEYAKVPQEINNMVGDNVKLLAQLFPAAVKDGQVDFEALKQELGQFEEVGKEKYELTWSGKQDAKKLAQEDVYNRTLKYIPEDSKNPETTENLYIEGDNLEVLKLLRQNYYGAIKMIYIDPPYNTDGDLIYNDKFKETAIESDILEGIRDENGTLLQENLKSSNRYHAKWINMIYPRLKIAKELLSDDGLIFISIDDNELENLIKTTNEIFGEKNYINIISLFAKVSAGASGGGEDRRLKKNMEYILMYAKNSDSLPALPSIYKETELIDYIQQMKASGKSFKYTNVLYHYADIEMYKTIKDGSGQDIAIKKVNNYEIKTVKQIAKTEGISEEKVYEKYFDKIMTTTNAQTSIRDRVWEATDCENNLYIATYIPGSGKNKGKETDLFFMGKQKVLMIWLKDTAEKTNGKIYKKEKIGTFWDGFSWINVTKEGDVKFENGKKPIALIQQLAQLLYDNEGVTILDFFSGSATTSHAVMQINAEDGGNRKFIMAQIPEQCEEKSESYEFLKDIDKPTNICEIGKERIRRAGEKIKQEIETANLLLKLGEEPKQVPDIGFKVFRTADTNIKWYLYDEFGQIDTATMAHTPDLADFTQGFTDIDVVYEVMLRQKDVPLSSTLETLSHIGNRTYLYGSAYLVCLETEITEDLIDKLAALDPLPIKFIFRDSAFKDDINLKDETFRRLKNLIERNSGVTKQTYTVEFI